METDLFGNPDSADTTKNSAAEAAKATRKAAPKDQASPLAERLRPKTIDEVVGQKRLLGPGKPLRSAFENAHPHSMILWGPPGVGKTTLAFRSALYFDFCRSRRRERYSGCGGKGYSE